MKFACVSNVNSIRFGLSFHLVLAQHVLNDSTYLAYFQLMKERDHFIMMDNGAAELGTSIPIQDICQAAALLEPDEIIFPDALDDYKVTLIESERALPYFPKRMRAMVPQGKNWAEWEMCAKFMVEMGCRTICVAKRYERFVGGRSYALEIIKKHGWNEEHDIHLLGCNSDPLLEISQALNVLPTIRSLDTAAPVSYAQNNQELKLGAPWHSLEWDKPADLDLVGRNIAIIVEACHAHYTKESSNKRN